MPAPHATPSSPPPHASSSAQKTPPPPPSPSSSSSVVHQVGSRQGTRTRTRTRRNMSSSANASHRTPRYTNEDHPMAPHNLAERGYHSFRCLGVPFHVKQRYTFVRELGIGAYGCVALCRDEVLDCNVAIKKIYLVLSASEADLSQIIRSGQSLSDAHHQYFMAQILRGVRYMHAAKVIHRDLKPSNLLVNGDCALRICDFGLARAYADSDEFHAPTASGEEAAEPKPRTSLSSSVDGDRSDTQAIAQEAASSTAPRSDSARSPSPASDLHVQLYKTDSKGKQKRLNYPGGPLTGYVATRWYRAPEDYVDQIARINNVLGSPSDAVLDKIGSERAKTYIKSLPNMPAVPLEKLYPNANRDALDLVAKLLTWDPDERLTAEEALQHPWLKAYHESNARWQSPQPFDKFADVEFIHSLRQFKSSLQREGRRDAHGTRGARARELESLGAHADLSHADANGNGAQHTPPQPDTAADSNANGEHENAAAAAAPADSESGNVQRADDAVEKQAQHELCRVEADAQPSDAPGPFHAADQEAGAETDSADALSCNASSQSGHLPADAASSSSSAHTPSSTSGASADEAEPPSPRLYETCGLSATALKSRAEHLEEGKALRKPPAFFRLGHEVEGRLLSHLASAAHADDEVSNDAFMPNQVLTVARGLVEYQSSHAAALAARESTLLPSCDAASVSHATHTKHATSPGPVAVTQAAVSGGTGGSTSQSSSGSASASRAQGGSRAAGAASTSSIGQSLLDDVMFAPAEGASSGLKSVSSQRQGKQLVVVQDSVVQSSVQLLRELVRRAALRSHTVVLVAALRRPETYLDALGDGAVATIDATGLGDVYTDDASALSSVEQLRERMRSELGRLGGGAAKTMVVVDSLNAVVRASSVAQANGRRRGKHMRRACGSAAFATHLGLGVDGSWCDTCSSSTDFGRRLAPAGDGEDEVDARFWEVLRNVSARGPMGIAAYEAGGGAQGWWSDGAGEACAFEPLSARVEPGLSTANGASGGATRFAGRSVTLADVLDASRDGYALLELHLQARNGKKHDELGALSLGSDGELRLLELDMTDRRSEAGAATPAGTPDATGGDKHQHHGVGRCRSTWARPRRSVCGARRCRFPYAYHQKRGRAGAARA
ncbi:hypothetical protein L1887_49674 [Cichorium endivia]|nr:hypothetical protein L1887_49674 [Cichorium endivia]